MTSWFLLSPQKNFVGIWPQGILFYRGTENFPLQSACLYVTGLLDETMTYWESTATPRKTLSLSKMTKAKNPQLLIITNSSLHKVRLCDLLKHITKWVNPEWKENPILKYSSAYIFLPYELDLHYFFPIPPISFPYLLGTQESSSIHLQSCGLYLNTHLRMAEGKFHTMQRQKGLDKNPISGIYDDWVLHPVT